MRNIAHPKLLKKNIRKITNIDFYRTRNGKIFANLSGSAIFKVINMIISFLMVPITLDYLDKTRYGLWAALSSVLAWFFIFDIGLGNGLRNKFTELKAKNDYNLLKSYVSTTYTILCLFAIGISVIFAIVNKYVNWAVILNAPASLQAELSDTVLIVFIVLCFSFVLKLINNILSADLKNALSDGINTVAHLISFIGIIIMSKLTSPSILKYALLYTGSNLLMMLIASIYLFCGRYRAISPSIKHIDFRQGRDLFSVGFRFFFIQIAGVVLYQTSSFVLANLVNPEAVTDYNITQKYYSLATMLFAMLVQPLWSAYGDAYHRNDFVWIKNTFKRLQKIWLFIAIILVGAFFMQDFVFKIWLKGKVEFNLSLSLAFVVYGLVFQWGSIYNPFLNATGKLKLQLILLFISVPLFIPLCILLVKTLQLGALGIVLALIFLSLPSSIIYTIQSKKILDGSDGIWCK